MLYLANIIYKLTIKCNLANGLDSEFVNREPQNRILLGLQATVSMLQSLVTVTVVFF
jgi:hypothetical protein